MPQAIHKNAYISFTDISIPVLMFLHDLGIFFSVDLRLFSIRSPHMYIYNEISYFFICT